MRVAMVAGSYPPMHCGIGDYTQRLCDALTGKDVRVTVWTGAGASVLTHHSSRTTHHAPAWTWRAVKQLVVEIAASQPDLVHVQYPGHGYGYYIAPTFFVHAWRRWGSGAPAVVTLHEFRIAHPLRKLAAMNLVRAADAVIVPAWCEQQTLSRFCPPRASSLTVIPPSANIPVQPVTGERCQELRAAWGVNAGDVLLCHFGFVQRNKGFPRLLRAFEEAYKQLPNLKLLLIGDRSPLISHPVSLIPLGYLSPEGVSECLSAADVCVLPYSDGASARRSTFWTALQHGLPIITTREGSETASMGLEHGDNVWLVSAKGNIRELCTAILTLARSQPLRQRLGANGRTLGVQNTWEKIASRTMEVYNGVVSNQ